MKNTERVLKIAQPVILAVVVVLLGLSTVFAGTTQADYEAIVNRRQTQQDLREYGRETGDWTAYDRFMWPGLITTSTPVSVSEETIRWKQSLVDDNKNVKPDAGTKVIASKTFSKETFSTNSEKVSSPAINAYEFKMQYMKDHPQETISKDVAFVGQMRGYSGDNIKNGYK